MHLSYWDISIIVFSLIVFFFIGYLSRQKEESIQSYFLGGRKLPWWLAGTSMVATTFAADTPLAVNELVVKYGISGNWLWWNMLAGGMLTTFFFARLWRRANITTDVELISIRYSGKPAKFLRAFKSIYLGGFMNIMVIGWVNLAMMSLFEVFFNVESKEMQLLLVLGCMIVIFLYSGMSGFLSVVYTDFLQFTMAMAGSIVLAYLVINSDDIGGLDGLVNRLPKSTLQFFPSFGGKEISNGLILGVGSFLTFMLMPWWSSWYPGAEPGGGGYIAQRIMSAKDEKNAVFSSLFFQVMHYCVRPWPWVLVALSTIIIYGTNMEGQERLGYVWAMKDYLPTGLKGLMLASFIAAYMSTISTQLNWGASYIINDLYIPFISKTKEYHSWFSRIVVIALMLMATVATYYINSISEVWSLIMKCGAGMGLVLILRWYWWRINAWSEITATLAPFVGYAICYFVLTPALGPEWNVDMLEDPRSFLFIVGFTTVAWLVVTFITKPTDRSVLDSFYSATSPGGFWPQSDSSKKEIGANALLWISSVVVAYGLLFCIGSLLLGTYQFMLWLFPICLVLFLFLLRKSKF